MGSFLFNRVPRDQLHTYIANSVSGDERAVASNHVQTHKALILHQPDPQRSVLPL